MTPCQWHLTSGVYCAEVSLNSFGGKVENVQWSFGATLYQ